MPEQIRIDLLLRYEHPLGALAPYFEGLAKGRAMATRSPSNGRVWFPPRIVCPYDFSETEWIELEGTGQIVSVTMGPGRLPLTEQVGELSFALIAVDGADNLTLGRVIGEGTPRLGSRVRLARLDEAPPHPAQAACFTLAD